MAATFLPPCSLDAPGRGMFAWLTLGPKAERQRWRLASMGRMTSVDEAVLVLRWGTRIPQSLDCVGDAQVSCSTDIHGRWNSGAVLVGECSPGLPYPRPRRRQSSD